MGRVSGDREDRGDATGGKHIEQELKLNYMTLHKEEPIWAWAVVACNAQVLWETPAGDLTG